MRWIMDRQRWAAVAVAISLAACDSLLGEKSHHCGATGAVCPESLACAPAPTFCGKPDDVAACSGAADQASCTSGSIALGYCMQGVCEACTPDYAFCHYAGWTQMTQVASDLYGVWVAGPGDAYAVGDAGAAYHYDGVEWLAVAPENATKLRRVWGLDHTMYTAGTDGYLHVLAPDSTWTRAKISTDSLDGVYAASASDIFTVGPAGEIFHFDSTNVTAQTSGTAQDLEALWGASASDLYAVGSRIVLHYNGSAWSAAPADAAIAYQAAHGTSGSDVYFVGNCVGTGCTGPVAQHFDGTWQPATALTQSAADTVRGVWTSAEATFAVGLVSGPAGPKSAAFRRDGSGWHVDMLDTPYELQAVAGSGPNDVYAVGLHGTIWHYGGAQ